MINADKKQNVCNQGHYAQTPLQRSILAGLLCSCMLAAMRTTLYCYLCLSWLFNKAGIVNIMVWKVGRSEVIYDDYISVFTHNDCAATVYVYTQLLF